MTGQVDCFQGGIERVVDCFRSKHPAIRLDEREWNLVRNYLDGRKKVSDENGGVEKISRFNTEWQDLIATTLGEGKKLSEDEKDALVDGFLARAGIFVQIITHHFSVN